MPTTFAAGTKIKSAEVNANYAEFLSADLLKNVGLACSVGSSALTIALKNAAGSDASATDACGVGFRSATLTNGQSSILNISAALSLVISSGSTLGHVSAAACEIYVGLLLTGGAAKLCVSTTPINERSLITTVAEGGAGAADSSTSIYSDAVYSNVPVRVIAKLISTQSTAGTWAAVPTDVQVGSYAKVVGHRVNSSVYLTGGNGYGATNTKIIRYDNSTVVGTDITYADTANAGMSLTINVAGTYAISRNDFGATINLDVGLSVNSTQLTTNVSSITAADRIAASESIAGTGTTTSISHISRTRYFNVGDIIRAHDNGPNADTADAYTWISIARVN